ncbi:hypothetical protein ISG33_09220 [Glaciecola sp. MH2013]|uniref:hypothetical protein n=1 Tax=Glaciecola sp. MH2013 TaxID=2785524 RepID=UPI00189CE400|nr:hypothetical protein [Glaciecola sp. MH2013]MBF7073572.1 hypothetical protein [Glaciecola sp. MH2013]
MMTALSFSYKGYDIKVELGYVGSEKVFINNKLVSESFNWKFKNDHIIELDPSLEQITVRVEVLSMMQGEMRISLLAGESVVEAKSWAYDQSGSGEGTHFNEIERKWTKEIKMAKSTTSITWALYFAILLYSIAADDWPNTVFEGAFILMVACITIYALFEFARSAVLALRSKVDDEAI